MTTATAQAGLLPSAGRRGGSSSSFGDGSGVSAGGDSDGGSRASDIERRFRACAQLEKEFEEFSLAVLARSASAATAAQNTGCRSTGDGECAAAAAAAVAGAACSGSPATDGSCSSTLAAPEPTALAAAASLAASNGCSKPCSSGGLSLGSQPLLADDALPPVSSHVEASPATTVAAERSIDWMRVVVTALEHAARLLAENAQLRWRCECLEGAKDMLEARLNFLLHADVPYQQHLDGIAAAAAATNTTIGAASGGRSYSMTAATSAGGYKLGRSSSAQLPPSWHSIMMAAGRSSFSGSSQLELAAAVAAAGGFGSPPTTLSRLSSSLESLDRQPVVGPTSGGGSAAGAAALAAGLATAAIAGGAGTTRKESIDKTSTTEKAPPDKGKLKGTLEKMRSKLKGTPSSPSAWVRRHSNQPVKENEHGEEQPPSQHRSSGFMQCEVIPPCEEPSDYGGVWLGIEPSDYGGVYLGPEETSPALPATKSTSSKSVPDRGSGVFEEPPRTSPASGGAGGRTSPQVLQMSVGTAASSATGTAAGPAAATVAACSIELSSSPSVVLTTPSPGSGSTSSPRILPSASLTDVAGESGTARQPNASASELSGDAGASPSTPDAAVKPTAVEIRRRKMGISDSRLAPVVPSGTASLSSESTPGESVAAVAAGQAAALAKSASGSHVSTKELLQPATLAYGRGQRSASDEVCASSRTASLRRDADAAAAAACHSASYPHLHDGASGVGGALGGGAGEGGRVGIGGGTAGEKTTRSSGGSGDSSPNPGRSRASSDCLATNGAPYFSDGSKPCGGGDDPLFAGAAGGGQDKTEKSKDKGKASRGRFAQRVKRELEKRLSRSKERGASRSKSCERAEVSDDFAEKLRDWSVKQGYAPDYYGNVAAEKAQTGRRGSHQPVDEQQQHHQQQQQRQHQQFQQQQQRPRKSTDHGIIQHGTKGHQQPSSAAHPSTSSSSSSSHVQAHLHVSEGSRAPHGHSCSPPAHSHQHHHQQPQQRKGSGDENGRHRNRRRRNSHDASTAAANSNGDKAPKSAAAEEGASKETGTTVLHSTHPTLSFFAGSLASTSVTSSGRAVTSAPGSAAASHTSGSRLSAQHQLQQQPLAAGSAIHDAALPAQLDAQRREHPAERSSTGRSLLSSTATLTTHDAGSTNSAAAGADAPFAAAFDGQHHRSQLHSASANASVEPVANSASSIAPVAKPAHHRQSSGSAPVVAVAPAHQAEVAACPARSVEPVANSASSIAPVAKPTHHRQSSGSAPVVGVAAAHQVAAAACSALSDHRGHLHHEGSSSNATQPPAAHRQQHSAPITTVFPDAAATAHAVSACRDSETRRSPAQSVPSAAVLSLTLTPAAIAVQSSNSPAATAVVAQRSARATGAVSRDAAQLGLDSPRQVREAALPEQQQQRRQPLSQKQDSVSDGNDGAQQPSSVAFANSIPEAIGAPTSVAITSTAACSASISESTPCRTSSTIVAVSGGALLTMASSSSLPPVGSDGVAVLVTVASDSDRSSAAAAPTSRSDSLVVRCAPAMASALAVDESSDARTAVQDRAQLPLFGDCELQGEGERRGGSVAPRAHAGSRSRLSQQSANRANQVLPEDKSIGASDSGHERTDGRFARFDGDAAAGMVAFAPAAISSSLSPVAAKTCSAESVKMPPLRTACVDEQSTVVQPAATVAAPSTLPSAAAAPTLQSAFGPKEDVNGIVARKVSSGCASQCGVANGSPAAQRHSERRSGTNSPTVRVLTSTRASLAKEDSSFMELDAAVGMTMSGITNAFRSSVGGRSPLGSSSSHDGGDDMPPAAAAVSVAPRQPSCSRPSLSSIRRRALDNGGSSQSPLASSDDEQPTSVAMSLSRTSTVSRATRECETPPPAWNPAASEPAGAAAMSLPPAPVRESLSDRLRALAAEYASCSGVSDNRQSVSGSGGREQRQRTPPQPTSRSRSGTPVQSIRKASGSPAAAFGESASPAVSLLDRKSSGAIGGAVSATATATTNRPRSSGGHAVADSCSTTAAAVAAAASAAAAVATPPSAAAAAATTAARTVIRSLSSQPSLGGCEGSSGVVDCFPLPRPRRLSSEGDGAAHVLKAASGGLAAAALCFAGAPAAARAMLSTSLEALPAATAAVAGGGIGSGRSSRDDRRVAVQQMVSQFEKQPHASAVGGGGRHVVAQSVAGKPVKSPMTKLKTAAELMTISTGRKDRDPKLDRHHAANVPSLSRDATN